MNQKGELTLFGILLTMGLTSVFILHSIQLIYNYTLFKRRAEFFICSKKSKILIREHANKIIKANWGIKNSDKIKYLSLFIPGFQGVGLKAEKVKILLKKFQDFELLKFRSKLMKLKIGGCSLEKGIFLSPFKTNASHHLRSTFETAIPQEKIWQIKISHYPFLMTLSFDLKNSESLYPIISTLSEERPERFLFNWHFYSSL
jgi:hypothetical protein